MTHVFVWVDAGIHMFLFTTTMRLWRSSKKTMCRYHMMQCLAKPGHSVGTLCFLMVFFKVLNFPHELLLWAASGRAWTFKNIAKESLLCQSCQVDAWSRVERGANFGVGSTCILRPADHARHDDHGGNLAISWKTVGLSSHNDSPLIHRDSNLQDFLHSFGRFHQFLQPCLIATWRLPAANLQCVSTEILPLSSNRLH